MNGFAMTEHEVVLLREWWADGDRTDMEIAERFGWKYRTLHRFRRELCLPWRGRRNTDYCPTPEQIAEEARRIKERHLLELRNEPEEVTQRRVADHRGGQRSIRCFTFAGECYSGAEALA